MRVLLVVHGFPPRETAGTERHTELLAGSLRERGHDVHVLAATRAPGRRQHEVLREPGVTRIVNNMTTRPLAQAERDRTVEALARDLARDVDLVHIQHTQFLSSGLRFEAPTVLTLHDRWGWCAAGGTGLLHGEAPCPGPSPDRCPACAAAWRPVPGRTARGLVSLAGALSDVVPPERLHAAYQRLPERLRAPVRRGVSSPESPAAALARNDAMRSLFARAGARISPSAHLAREAERLGYGPVTVVRHGVPHPARQTARRHGLLFLGTIARHKGPDLVVEGWRRAFPGGEPPLRLHGPVVDAGLVDHPLSPPLDRAGVQHALARASALVIGSRWPENAPLVVLEARAAGCPVIAPRIGGIPEIVEDGVDGLLYAPGDAGDLARVLRGPLPSRVRPPPTVDQMVEATLAVYRRVTG